MSVHMTKTKKHNELEILRPFKILCQFSIIKLTLKIKETDAWKIL